MAENKVKEMPTNFEKLDKFEGHDFRRWQKKMHFLLTTLKVVYVLTTPMTELMEDDTVEAIRRRVKWENDDYICRGHILNGMSDSLFDVYQNVESAKELWDLLESKYMAEDASIFAYRGFSMGARQRQGQGKEVNGPSVNMTEKGMNKTNKTKVRNVISKRITVVLVPTRNLSWNVGSVVRLVTLKEIFVVVIRKTQMVVVRKRGLRTNLKTKWIDSGATTYVCKYRAGLRHMNRWKTDLYFTWVYESDKYILSKSGVFVGFGYYNNGHVHYKRMLEMSKDDLIPAIDENLEKCTTFDKTKKFLSSRFSMKDMREADVILGIKIKRENKGILITQSYYIEKILKKFDREDCSPVSTPIDPVEKLRSNTEFVALAAAGKEAE
nr:zinc finger, CCHC-type [Tanacetum cinerariifolium]